MSKTKKELSTAETSATRLVPFADLPKVRIGVHIPKALAIKSKHAALDLHDGTLNKLVTEALALRLGEDPKIHGIGVNADEPQATGAVAR